MDKIEKARDLYVQLEQHGIEVRGRVTLCGAAVPPALERAAREVADELRLLAAARTVFPQSADAFVDSLRSRLTESDPPQKPGLPCTKCNGSGHEPSALEQWKQIEYLLQALMWPPERIAMLHDEIRENETLSSVRHGGVDLKSRDGSSRTILRFQ